jgi:hypothetical protein
VPKLEALPADAAQRWADRATRGSRRGDDSDDARRAAALGERLRVREERTAGLARGTGDVAVTLGARAEGVRAEGNRALAEDGDGTAAAPIDSLHRPSRPAPAIGVPGLSFWRAPISG